MLEVEVTDNTSVKNAIQTIIDEQGKLDVLINNAGHFIAGLAETFTEKDVDNMFNVHVKGSWFTIKETLPHMRKQHEGLIINTSSVLGRFSSPFMTFYNAAKFAVEGISEGLHYEVRPLGVDVAILQPGAFPTEIFSKAQKSSDDSVAEAYGELATIPDKIGTNITKVFEEHKPDPQQVADAVLHLIELPKGKRPLRTVVDNLTGTVVEEANAHVNEGYKNFISALGLQELLN